MSLYCDSKAALRVAANAVLHERMKHIDINRHFVRNEIKPGNVATYHVRTQDQLAYILTKGLGKSQFDHLLRKSGIQNLHAPT